PSDAGFSRDPPGGNCRDERGVVTLGLVGVGLGEPADRLLERVVVAGVAGDLGGLPGPGVAAGEGPAAEVPPGSEVVDHHRLDDRAALLVLELADRPAAALR